MHAYTPALVCGNPYVTVALTILTKGVCTQQYGVGYSLSLLYYLAVTVIHYRVLSRKFGLGRKGAWYFHAQSPPPNH